MTTYSEDKSPNAAPMGIIFIDEQEVIISPFLKTQTFTNMERTGYAVINFVYDLEIFFESTFNLKRPKLPREIFKSASKVAAPRLEGAIIWVEVQVQEVWKEGNRARVKCKILKWESSQIPFLPLNRGYYLTLESIIHTTRILEFQKDSEKVKPLINLVQQYKSIIEKVAPTMNYVKIMNQLQMIIEKTGLWN